MATPFHPYCRKSTPVLRLNQDICRIDYLPVLSLPRRVFLFLLILTIPPSAALGLTLPSSFALLGLEFNQHSSTMGQLPMGFFFPGHLRGTTSVGTLHSPTDNGTKLDVLAYHSEHGQINSPGPTQRLPCRNPHVQFRHF